MTDQRNEIPSLTIAPVHPGEPVGTENFRHFAEAIPLLTWTAEPDGIVDYLSPRYLQFVGVKVDSAGALEWSRYVHPEDLDGMSNVWNNAVREQVGCSCEFRLHAETGEYRWFNARATPVFDVLGKLVKWYGITIDIDARKNAEIELHKASEDKDRFIATLSHELRNPLAAISTSYEVLSSGRCDKTQRSDALQLLGRQIKHLSRLVDDTIDIARLTSGRTSLTLAPVDLASVARECCKGLLPIAEQNGFTLNVEAGTTPIWVDGDEVRLSQCLTNLIDNGMKFSPSPGSIRVSVRACDASATLEVQDSGIGMEGEDIKGLFKPFTQGLGAGVMSKDGLGLGLAVLKELVDLHKGNVEVVSPGRGKGTLFRIILAKRDAPEHLEPSERQPTQAKSYGTTPRNVLVIEDNPSVLRSLEIFFEIDGHKVRTAEDGESAFLRISEEIPDIIFCDLSLSGDMMGWDIAERIVREIPSSRRPLLIALSGHIQKKFVQHCLDAGFDQHLSKPTSPAELRRCLELAGH